MRLGVRAAPRAAAKIRVISAVAVAMLLLAASPAFATCERGQQAPPGSPPCVYRIQKPTTALTPEPTRVTTLSSPVSLPAPLPPSAISPPPPPAPAYNGAPEPPPTYSTYVGPSSVSTPNAAEQRFVQRAGPYAARHVTLSDVAPILGGLWTGRGESSDLVVGATPVYDGVMRSPGSANAARLSPAEAPTITAEAAYKDSIPGGVVLEGAAAFGPLTSLDYDGRFNALILNDSVVYFMRVPPATVSQMADAIADDDRVGVSLGDVPYVYGRVPATSDFAYDMKIADNFLAEIVFATPHWTRGYRFANGYTPQPSNDPPTPLAVFFSFNGFQFQVRSGELEVTHVNLDARLAPLLPEPNSEGNLVPDTAAMARGEGVPAAYVQNARHITDNLSYYRRERIIDHMFEYGALVSILRGLKYQGFNLHSLARAIDATRTS